MKKRYALPLSCAVLLVGLAGCKGLEPFHVKSESIVTTPASEQVTQRVTNRSKLDIDYTPYYKRPRGLPLVMIVDPASEVVDLTFSEQEGLNDTAEVKAAQTEVVMNPVVSPAQTIADEPYNDPNSTSWEVKVSDGTVSKTLRRWSSKAGWAFDSSNYEAVVDLPIVADVTLIEKGTYKDAVIATVDSLAQAGYPVRACFYLGNVLRIIEAHKSCQE